VANDSTLGRARAGDPDAFGELTEPHRSELLVHCYRILGPVPDAEDLVQETLLAAWRGLDGFEGRSSMRTWLYRIATNRCLNALRDDGRRPEGHRSAPELSAAFPEPTRMGGEPSWLEPYPDTLLDGIPDATPGPEARYESAEAISLPFIAALQRLPTRQRIILVLRDVLGFRAAEVADMLQTSQDSVTSALKRARAALSDHLPADRPPRTAQERDVADRFVAAFERGDVAAIVGLLTDDARLTMPPLPFEYQGHDAIAGFLSTVGFRGGTRRTRLVATRANGQPAYGCYVLDPHAPIARANGMVVLTTSGNRITAITRFLENSVLPRFGLPRGIPVDRRS
jgi:RNA polymerase sigma-70 factor (TIGR02960 family)